MKSLSAAVLLAGAAAFLSVAAAQTPSATWVLKGRKIYPAPDVPAIDNGVVVVASGKITAVGKEGSVEVPAGVRTSECSGGVVAAGFQNSHVHFTEPKWEDAAQKPAAELTRHFADMLTRYGFSNVVDTGSDVANTAALRARVASGEVKGPRILTAGMGLYPPNGIPFYLRDLPPRILQQLPQPATPEAALESLRENFRLGADALKLFVATPQADRSIRYMPVEIARAAVDEAHRRGALALAHPTDVKGVQLALSAGVDVLVHTTIDGDAKWDVALARELVKGDVSVIPTLKLWRYELGRSKAPPPVQKQVVAVGVEGLRVFSAAGGSVLFGTDVGYVPDYDPADEYELMAEAGLTPPQILASLTTAPAARWKEQDRRGRVAPGMDADLVVLEADPTADVRNFAKVRCTFRNGQPIYTVADRATQAEQTDSGSRASR